MAKAEKKKDGIWDTLKTIFWALVIAGLFRTILFQPFSIPSGSMKPELLVGDYLFVSKFAYGYSRYSLPFEPDLFEGRIWSDLPERGDVVVFKHPRHDACSRGPLERIGGFFLSLAGVVQANLGDCRDYIKRVVGLPGDTLEMHDKLLMVNGERLDEPWAIHIDRNRDAVHPGMRWQGNHLIAGRPIDGYAPSRDTWGPIVVPPERFFVLGDNRDNSEDSRYWGWVDRDRIRGRPWFVYYSWDRQAARVKGWLAGIRWDRIGRSVR